ncbi:hypothetical protein NUW54_g1424 [Trametes sanguinea]|uniref:Uncharacterized protein n=1 Tax=Trametes sanguinea TaxID=158606 RepID=A0ACC1Q6D7_9APHY|nr:hypothetical protein NUW54_g1424 [Trametes sanguinea]
MSAASSGAMMGSPTPSFPSLDSTVGAYVLGTFVSLILYGVCTHQFYRYMRQFPTDHWMIKGLDSGDASFYCPHAYYVSLHAHCWPSYRPPLTRRDSYYYLVNNYANPLALADGVWSLNVIPTLAATIVLASECFFARRVTLIGFWSKVVATIAVLCLLAGSGLSVALTVKAFQITDMLLFGEQAKVLAILSLALDAIGDCLLVGAIIAALRQRRDSHAISSISEVAELYILNTGLLVGILQAIGAILAIRYPLKLYYAAHAMVVIRMYGVTLLSVLNSRKLLLSRGIRVFKDESTFGRAHRLATVERWNVPHNRDDTTPPVMSVKVAAEIEVHGQSDSDLNGHYDLKEMRTADP